MVVDAVNVVVFVVGVINVVYVVGVVVGVGGVVISVVTVVIFVGIRGVFLAVVCTVVVAITDAFSLIIPLSFKQTIHKNKTESNQRTLLAQVVHAQTTLVLCRRHLDVNTVRTLSEALLHRQ